MKHRYPHGVETTGVILAGGQGTRLRSVVADRPKVLAVVNGRPFITYLLDQLVDIGIPSCVLCTGYLAEQVSDCLGEDYRGMILRYSVEAEPLGTGGALQQALPLMENEQVLVMNGDSYLNADLGVALEPRPTSRLLLTEVEDASRYGKVTLDGQGCVVRFEEKSPIHAPGTINAGIYCFRIGDLRDGFANLPCRCSLEKELLPAIVKAGRLLGLVATGWFIDIGTEESYARSSELLRSLAV